MSERQLLCLARIDLAEFTEPDLEDTEFGDESLFSYAVLAGSEGWAGLLKAAEAQEGDDRTINGYIVKAWSHDPVTGFSIGCEEWLDLCQEQVARMFEHLEGYARRASA
ncbi:MAG: hypothetical protein IH849_01180 [Acidobacteria bacterium]|nr:hypothetical protein [Acidobacteriota bacterium]